MQRIAKLVCFGRGGDSVEYGGGCRGSGYGSPEKPHAAHPDEIPDGTPVIDKRPAVDTAEGYSWVFKGPIVNVDLPDNVVDACPQPSAALAAGVAGNAYGSLLAMQAAHAKPTPGPLDSVSTQEYIAGWRAVGARIGHYEKGVIVWE